MDVLKLKIICVCITTASCIAPYNNAFAVIDSPPTTAPITLPVGESLNVTSGTLATKDSTPYTVRYVPSAATQLTTVNAGATVTYEGNNSSASTLLSTLNDTVTGEQNILNYGTISKGAGLYAINFTNINPTPNNLLNILNYGTIIGDVEFVGGQIGPAATMVISGKPVVPGTSQVQGNISFRTIDAIGYHSTLFVGFLVPGEPPTNFISGGTISNFTELNIVNSSIMTLNHSSFNIGTVTILPNCVLNLNKPMTGTSAGLGDGTIFLEAGTINIAADIFKTGIFQAQAVDGGFSRIKENVNIYTSTYNFATGVHIAELTDLYHYGKATFVFAEPDFSTFNTEYGGGYLSTGTYTLVKAPTIGTAPTTYGPTPIPTMFLSFGTPYVSGNTILIDIVSTNFETYASNGLTQQIANAVDFIGQNNPPEIFMPILNALERSTSPVQLNTGLRELAPIISAPLYMFMLQDSIYEQVHMRVAGKKKNAYSSGDQYSDYTPWVRGLYDKAKQNAVDDCSGYYASTGGGFIGVDKQVNPNFIIGGAFAYTNSRVNDQINNSSYTDVSGYNFMLYGSHDFKPWYATWVLGLGYNNYKANRNIDFNSLQLNATGKYNNNQIGGSVLLGSNFRPANYLQISPEASILYSMGSSYDYSENGGSGANLQVLTDIAYFVQTSAGAKFESPLLVHSMIFVPEIHVNGLYNIANGTQNMHSGFLFGGPQFVSRAGLSKFGIKYGASITLATRDTLELKFNYDHTTLGGYNDNLYYLNIRYTL